MADQEIKFTVPDAKVTKAVQGYLSIFPNEETVADPMWVDPEDGSEAPQIPKYTDAQWIREHVRRNFIHNVRRGLQKAANEAAIVAEDDGLAI